MRCNACGNEIPNGSTMCPFCGSAIKNENDVEKTQTTGVEVEKINIQNNLQQNPVENQENSSDENNIDVERNVLEQTDVSGKEASYVMDATGEHTVVSTGSDLVTPTIEPNKKKSKNIIGIIQSFLILILVVLIIFMMIQISRLQGTARVINYAGLVRGATQREVKLEITGNQNDELIKYLDDILLGLRYQDGHYNLVKLNDEEYQGKLKIQSDYWDKLKTEIEAVRNKGYENTDIVNMSEIYFTMADETVSAAESYSEKIAIKIRTIELLSALDMLTLVILVIMQTLKAMQMAMQNRLLEQKAFVDAHTGLPNKNACNELLNKKDIITGSTACIMFDLNNLKTVNDTMGHSAGDQLIMNFSKLLRSVIPEKDFVGRYGGDEFIAVIYHTNEAEIKEILKVLYREKDRLNSYENQIPIDYACGWALSSDDMSCTMQMLLDDADAYMYKNKQLCKKYN